ncbi:peptide chain release factor N(5)-glutamine methyltransferase [Wenzhouxiangella sp. AB-CW3]|uniref:peptide chain release factor N(5)-glutamine methyltransferase n=1 Tax=Wenzhouxiangella sp. AB-CW3 TaxID=2771012 RepID=UPI00168BD0F8|nr:peptide chain release factor N(5)-glutamine methyltransferase [Wenzhouxiangella sp. AB-CW3]QOC21443.1 peptide chain release factor N(5)-glutamine methyltransferase [Wenzhouxiangella sp. AB-CW3]
MQASHIHQTVADLLAHAAGRMGSRMEAEMLLAWVLDRDRAWLYAHADEYCDPESRQRFDGLVARRLEGVPVAHLTGWREFHDYRFRVTPDVLVPRPETELLIELALESALPDAARVLDIGTGSGCVALTLALERPDWDVCGTDVSGAALSVAKDNRNHLQADVELLEGSLFEPVQARRFHLVVSNPPYVAAGDAHLDQADLQHEPQLALVAGTDGLDLIRDLIVQAPRHLEPGGSILIEHGHDQAMAVRRLLQAAGFRQVGSRQDLAGIERVSFGRIP